LAAHSSDYSRDDAGPTRSLRIQATINSQATDKMIGPIKSPTIPCASVPPITPMKMTSVGVVRPRPITNGFNMLSSTPTMPRNSVIKSAVVKSLVVQSQMITGSRTIPGTDLHDGQKQNRKGEEACARNPCQFEANAGQ